MEFPLIFGSSHGFLAQPGAPGLHGAPGACAALLRWLPHQSRGEPAAGVDGWEMGLREVMVEMVW